MKYQGDEATDAAAAVGAREKFQERTPSNMQLQLQRPVAFSEQLISSTAS